MKRQPRHSVPELFTLWVKGKARFKKDTRLSSPVRQHRTTKTMASSLITSSVIRRRISIQRHQHRAHLPSQQTPPIELEISIKCPPEVEERSRLTFVAVQHFIA
nr:hypothetical protein Iba_chr12fCG4970 [Ipomoea batatas]